MAPKLKKAFGQHFLRAPWVVIEILDAIAIDEFDSVFEIGGGDGYLTRALLSTKLSRLWVFEIDEEWASLLSTTISDSRVSIFYVDFLEADLAKMREHGRWKLAANLPYKITFPVLERLIENRDLIIDAVLMLQEEVARKICDTRGRSYGYFSVYLQHFFKLKLLSKIPPEAFIPRPKIFSRLLYLCPKSELRQIPREAKYWEFVRIIFSHPRRTIRNNLKGTAFASIKFSEEVLSLRAQQLSPDELAKIWESNYLLAE